jgi:hypothetical protein
MKRVEGLFLWFDCIIFWHEIKIRLNTTINRKQLAMMSANKRYTFRVKS